MDMKKVHDVAAKYILILRSPESSMFSADGFISDLKSLGFRDDDRTACSICGLDSFPYCGDVSEIDDIQVIGNALLTYFVSVLNVPGGQSLVIDVYDTVVTFLVWLSRRSGGMESCGVYRFCQVVFSDFGGAYSYLVPDGMEVHAGDKVSVPVRSSSCIKTATVVSCGEYMDFVTPVPVSMAKEIIAVNPE